MTVIIPIDKKINEVLLTDEFLNAGYKIIIRTARTNIGESITRRIYVLNTNDVNLVTNIYAAHDGSVSNKIQNNINDEIVELKARILELENRTSNVEKITSVIESASIQVDVM